MKKVAKYVLIAIAGIFLLGLISSMFQKNDAANSPQVKAFTDSLARETAKEKARAAANDSLEAKQQAEKDSAQAIITAKENRKQRLEQNFSAWDGSHRTLEKYIKTNLNDPDSYEHVETKYWDLGDENIVVLTTYRAKNAFGAKMLGRVKAKTNINGDILKILESE